MSKLTKCKTCQKDVAKTAKTCPHCGAKNKQTGGCATFIILVIITVICFSALQNSDKTEPQQSKKTVPQITKSSNNSKEHFEYILKNEWKLDGNVYRIRSNSHGEAWYFGAKIKNKSTGKTKKCVWLKFGSPTTAQGLTLSVNNEAFQVSGMGMLNKSKAAVIGGDKESDRLQKFLNTDKK